MAMILIAITVIIIGLVVTGIYRAVCSTIASGRRDGQGWKIIYNEHSDRFYIYSVCGGVRSIVTCGRDFEYGWSTAENARTAAEQFLKDYHREKQLIARKKKEFELSGAQDIRADIIARQAEIQADKEHLEQMMKEYGIPTNGQEKFRQFASEWKQRQQEEEKRSQKKSIYAS